MLILHALTTGDIGGYSDKQVRRVTNVGYSPHLFRRSLRTDREPVGQPADDRRSKHGQEDGEHHAQDGTVDSDEGEDDDEDQSEGENRTAEGDGTRDVDEGFQTLPIAIHSRGDHEPCSFVAVGLADKKNITSVGGPESTPDSGFYQRPEAGISYATRTDVMPARRGGVLYLPVEG